MAALDLLGRRWTLRVIWELHRDGSPIGFRDLQRRCDDMSSSVLSTRLTELREAGIAASTTAAQPAWHLTALGDDLVTAMGPLLDWSRAWAERRKADPGCLGESPATAHLRPAHTPAHGPDPAVRPSHS
ncbi:winged helix-turn-helix transcriptional regulator [Streptomyces mirabilis]|uniref:winged helix-turn-helix transcriptional regulator n=1 Tax=Streptomyces mirabilis TaxID=68239 RepID=UPI0036B3E0FC